MSSSVSLDAKWFVLTCVSALSSPDQNEPIDMNVTFSDQNEAHNTSADLASDVLGYAQKMAFTDQHSATQY